MAEIPEWVRVSTRGRYHEVVGVRPTGAFETGCGRILPPSTVATKATGASPGPLCDRCRKPVDKKAS